MPPIATPARIAAVRRFNRFYTQKIGVLNECPYGSPYSLTEVRILYELAHRDSCTASELCRDLALDAGYVSRVLRDFARRKLLARRRCDRDGRVSHLSLTAIGRKAFAPLDSASRRAIQALLKPLEPSAQLRLLDALQTVTHVLQPTAMSPVAAPTARTVSIRTHRPGDIGWIIHRHGALYAQEYGWDARFEALVAEIGARFLREFDRACERCWIAELDGVPVGSVVLVRAAESTPALPIAQLRLLLVEPTARGHGVGRRLVRSCIVFARKRGYRKIMLWTNSNLDAARHLYVEAGFALIKEEPHEEFGTGLIGQHWERAL